MPLWSLIPVTDWTASWVHSNCKFEGIFPGDHRTRCQVSCSRSIGQFGRLNEWSVAFRDGQLFFLTLLVIHLFIIHLFNNPFLRTLSTKSFWVRKLCVAARWSLNHQSVKHVLVAEKTLLRVLSLCGQPPEALCQQESWHGWDRAWNNTGVVFNIVLWIESWHIIGNIVFTTSPSCLLSEPKWHLVAPQAAVTPENPPSRCDLPRVRMDRLQWHKSLGDEHAN